MIRLVLAVLVAGSAGACRPPEPPTGSAGTLAALWAAEKDAFRKLPVCSLPALGDTTGWHRPYRAAALLPPGFRLDSVHSAGYIHGGRLWRDAAREYAEYGASYAWSSFGADSRARCRLPWGQGAALVVRQDRGEQYRAWVAPFDTIAERLVSRMAFEAAGPAADSTFLLRVLQTVRPRPTGRP